MSNVARETGPEKWVRLLGAYPKGETFKKFQHLIGETSGNINTNQIFAYIFTELDDLREDNRVLRQNIAAAERLLFGMRAEIRELKYKPTHRSAESKR